MTSNAATYTANLESIIAALSADPGLAANVSAEDFAGGVDATRNLNILLSTVMDETGVNLDGRITTDDLMVMSDAIRLNSTYFSQFVAYHGDDEGSLETGFHLLQNDGGLLKFQGRALVDTIVDAIFHIGFNYYDGRFVNEDGNINEQVADVAGWLNYFLNGTNIVYGTAGDDELHSGEYSSVLADAANETFDAGDGNDRIWAGDGNDKVLAGSGDDVSGGGAGDDDIRGGNGMDQLWGDYGNDRIAGQAGDDSIGGGFGNDRLRGGSGNDEVYGEEGNDSLWGGGGDDILGGGSGNDRMNGDGGNDTMWGSDGKDLMNGGNGNDDVGGGLGDDTIDGGDGNDKVSGNEGADSVAGGAGDDQVWGGSGNDRLYGDDGNDTISAGEGADAVRGGKGADLITLWDDDNARDMLLFNIGDSGLTKATIDSVEGFQSGEDVINLKSFGAMSLGELDFVGGGKASVIYDGHYLRIDADGDRASDLIIEFKWVSELVASDFIFA